MVRTNSSSYGLYIRTRSWLINAAPQSLQASGGVIYQHLKWVAALVPASNAFDYDLKYTRAQGKSDALRWPVIRGERRSSNRRQRKGQGFYSPPPPEDICVVMKFKGLLSVFGGPCWWDLEPRYFFFFTAAKARQKKGYFRYNTWEYTAALCFL